MNLILKIVQGPNAGAEVALIEGVNVKLGRSDECDIVVADQTLPDVACELEVGSEKVMLLLPGGGQERLEPLRVKVFETTAIAIGPADAPWGSLIWPSPEDEKPEEPAEPPPEEQPPAEKPRFRTLQLVLLVALILVVVLEFLLWFFWPYLNKHVEKARIRFQEKYEEWTADELEKAAKPIHTQTLGELATAYGVEAIIPPVHSEQKPILRGNLKSRAVRLKLTADAYALHPGCVIELTDDESLRRSAEEILYMLTEGKLEVEKAENRQLALKGRLESLEEMKRVLTALNADLSHLEKVELENVVVGEVEDDSEGEDTASGAADGKEVDTLPVMPEPTVTPVSKSVIDGDGKAAGSGADKSGKSGKGGKKPAASQKAVAQTAPALPLVGVLTVPYPCLVLSDGSRILEGADFNGFVISKISEDVILVNQGGKLLEWRP